MNKKWSVEIIEFTDPVCTWCWGSEPILRKLETHYEGNIKISFVMGGLVKDIRTFRDSMNNIGGDLATDNINIAKHWLEASERHGMPVAVKGFNLFSNEHPSSYPMNIAYKAAQFQDEALANKFLRRMREAAAAEARQANQSEVLIELAQDCGLNVANFIRSLSEGTAEKAFAEDLKTAQKYKAFGFPSFLVKSSDGREIMLRGYQPFENFKEVISHLTNGELVEKKIEKTQENILNFINKYEHVTPAEIQAVFELSGSELDETLQELLNQNLMATIPAGNGYFVTPPSEGLLCDAGICHI